MNVLVFPCGSEIGLEIYQALNYSKDIEIYGGSSVDNHGKFLYKNYIGDFPDIEDENFIYFLNEIIKKYSIDFVYPAHDSVVLKLSKNSKDILCEIICADEYTCNICRSKRLTYELFSNILRTPNVYKFPGEFPIFLKPDVGQGSKGVFLAKNFEDLKFYLNKDSSLLMLEYLPGKEYTIDCITQDKKILFCEGRIRNRISNGISVNTYRIENNKFREIAEKINLELNFKGAWFFQLKEDKNNELTLLEIAPRIAGSMGLYRNLGINFPLLSIYISKNIPIEIIFNSNYNLKMDRALVNRFITNLNYKTVYIDLDDTIIFKEKINIKVISFLFQCVNNNKKIILLTKHIGDIFEYLSKYKIDKIFDSIIQINKKDEKNKYIIEKESIFIDDSFVERKNIKNIPTFDISMLDSLME